jgi:peptide/nickel transport system permease protein
VIVLWGAITLSFLVLHFVPGDPVDIMLGGDGSSDSGSTASAEQKEELRAQLGLDRPIIVQYLTFVWGALRLDFGNSYSTMRPVSDLVLEGLPHTLQLGAVSILLTVALGFVFALGSVLLPTAALRSLFQTITVVGVSFPSFWVGIILLQVFSFGLGWFPAFGNEGFQTLILPAFTLALITAGSLAQVLTRGLNDALAQPYADTARAKGVTHVRLVVNHALRNASLPVFTMVGMLVGSLLSGATIVETVFGRYGLGSIMVRALQTQDFPVIQAFIVLSGGLFVIVTLIVDLLYRYIDPRVVLPNSGSAKATLFSRRSTQQSASTGGVS